MTGQPKRYCFYIPANGFVEGHGFVPSMVTENEPGHAPLTGNGAHASPWYWGMTYDKARAVADQANANLGLTPDDVAAIIASSLGASPEGGGTS
jgi:hypothetical protein